MAKRSSNIKSSLKLLVPGGAATPAPPVGSALGQHGVNIMDFCKQFNAKTADRKGETVPVIITVFKDRTFTFVIKTAPTSELIKKRANAAKGSARPNEQKVGKISWRDVEDIAKIKLPDLNTRTLEEAKKIVAGTARSMGVDVIEG
ncbi:50S ribosomal protein L11 [Candidatus Dependentiae bacterium]|nr:50S ribosomal protein L11 [Candidatus Dependentiae bacterium]